MKLVVEPLMFCDLIERALVCKGTTSLIDSVVAILTPKSLKIRVMDEGMHVGSYGMYMKQHFMEYSIEGKQEKLHLTQTLLKILQKQFKGDKKITISTSEDKETIYLRGARETYKEDVLDVDLPEFPIEMKLVKGVGVIPEGMDPNTQAKPESDEAEKRKLEQAKAKVQVMIPVEEIKNFPETSESMLKFVVKDGKLSIHGDVEGGGHYSKELNIDKDKLLHMKDVEVNFDTVNLSHITSNLTGEVCLTIGDNSLALSQLTTDHAVTFLQTAKTTEE